MKTGGLPEPVGAVMAPSDQVSAYVVAANLTAVMAVAWDKECARNGMWRIPERGLLALALIGGLIGVIAGQRIFRNKSQKEPFRTYLRMIVIIQFTVLVLLALPDVRSAVLGFFALGGWTRRFAMVSIHGFLTMNHGLFILRGISMPWVCVHMWTHITADQMPDAPAIPIKPPAEPAPAPRPGRPRSGRPAP